MTDNHWQQIEALYHAALAREADERPAFLQQACAGDEALRHKVESLLSHHHSAADFLESPALELVAPSLDPSPSSDKTFGSTLIGRTLGGYQIIAPLGKGGMGEVFLAQDQRLGRQVALKVLAAQFTKDAERLRRFQQEARAASSLNHPNILTIHEIGEIESFHFIATEYIEGQTLRQHLTKARIKLGEVVEIALQVASALTAAHQAGIVHRDIKPENVMVRPDGYVKVVDFGLAKLTEKAVAPPTTDSNAATMAKVSTDTGLVMGTSYYMSPEQARGLKVDHRTDIFSFGVLLYELLAERRPFEGATTSDVIVAILEKEPPPLALYVPEIPSELQRIVSKALEKNCDERYQTIKDLQLDLKRLKQQLEVEAALRRANQSPVHLGISDSEPGLENHPLEVVTDNAPTVSTNGTEAAHTSGVGLIITEITRHKTGVAVSLLVVVLVLIAVAFGVYRLMNWKWSVAPKQALKITQLTISGKAGDPAVSPDGKYIAYTVRESGQFSLWLRQVDTGTDIQIQPPTARRFPGLVFSPDGNYLYYGRAKQIPDNPFAMTILYRIPVLGGTPKKVHENVNSTIGFSPDGKQFAFIRRDRQAAEDTLWIANSDGSDEREVVKQPHVRGLGGFLLWTAPAWSPDGKTIICSGHDRLFAVNLAQGTHAPIPTQKWYRVFNLRWLSDGSGLILSLMEREGDAQQLWYVAYPSGAAHRLTNDQNNYEKFNLTADNKTLVAVQSSDLSYLSVASANDFRQATQIQSPASYGANLVYWTPDNQLLYNSASNGMPILCQMDADGRNQKQLTELLDWDSNQSAPCLTADGRYIVFQAHRTKPGLWRIDLDGSNPKRLTEEGNSPRSSPDGKWIVYGVRTDEQDWSAWKVPIDGGEAVQLSKEFGAWPDVSPDGKWVLCTRISGENPSFLQSKIAIIPIAGGAPVKLFDRPPRAIRYTYRWMSDGKAFSFINFDEDVFNIWRQPLDGGAPTKITDFSSNGVTWYDWSRDGKQLVLIRDQRKSDIVAITNFR